MIEVQDLTKNFKGRTVLNGISFEVKEGEIFGYLGPNGAGKTTTMRIILGLLKPTSGKTLVWGQSLGEKEELRRKVGVLLEHDGLYERLSAYENLDYFARLYGVFDRQQKIKDLLDIAGLAERGNDKVGKFSRGMKRKLALTRAIIHKPAMLFLDEPSAGLDPEAQIMVRELILRLAREEKITIFLNSHDLDEVQRICSGIAILQKGEIKAYDSVGNLRNRFSKPVVQISLTDSQEVEKALSLIKSLDYVTDFRSSDMKIEATLTEGNKSSTLLKYLIENGVRVEESRRLTTSLEDVYMEITQNSRDKA